MGGIVTGFSNKNPKRVWSFSLLLAAVLPLVHLLWDLLPRLSFYTNVEYEVSMLAALVAAGCLGHLIIRVYQNSGGPVYLCSFLYETPTPDIRLHTEVSVESADWPLLVALLFGPFLVLLAGLGGWV